MPATLEAVRAFRTSGDFALLLTIVTGVFERFVNRELRVKLAAPDPDLRLIEDLDLDSLTLMEIVILTEDVFPVTITNEELRHLRTLGDVSKFIEGKLRGLPLPPALADQPGIACATTTAPPPA